jgi:hypothetical protein
LRDQDYEARLEAALTLLRFCPGHPKALAALASALEGDHARDTHQLRILAALGEAGPAAKVTVPAILRLWQNYCERWVRVSILRTLVRIGPEAAALPTLVRILEQEDWCVPAAEALLRLDPEHSEGWDVLNDALQDERLRLKAAASVVRLGRRKEDALERLRAALQGGNAATREEAAYWLGECGPAARTALPFLEAALADSRAKVRKAAADAAHKITGQP